MECDILLVLPHMLKGMDRRDVCMAPLKPGAPPCARFGGKAGVHLGLPCGMARDKFGMAGLGCEVNLQGAAIGLIEPRRQEPWGRYIGMGESNHKGWQGSTPPSLLFLYFRHVVPGEMAIPMKPIVAFLLVATQSTGGGGGSFPKRKIKAL